ncbi:uncharacterized protein CMU_042370 [Cryptosporidium muris RN66]|uniref:Uncharacterized protein n=1 Tax=Cryptosporidium muris (strain RN66) TaxID=441375 RepID=B6AAC3_CRYMR|nr:uncharacterized protein CMU_042370 [Cryptosporidium muris RN66]EEA05164.1 hypothetical protein, conserved [Cryptosporidium muris RN66]|eukprot:XP_002139513.1 hypothetical protein [Cryptosporidium muris RN66]
MFIIIYILLSEVINYIFSILIKNFLEWLTKPNLLDIKILKLEKEICELNYPSTFTLYVQKTRELNMLKRQREIYLEKNKFNNIKQNFISISKYIFNIWLILPNYINLLIIFLIISNLYLTDIYYIYIDQRIYYPLYQDKYGKIQFNRIISFSIILPIYNFIRSIFKRFYSYIFINYIDKKKQEQYYK